MWIQVVICNSLYDATVTCFVNLSLELNILSHWLDIILLARRAFSLVTFWEQWWHMVLVSLRHCAFMQQVVPLILMWLNWLWFSGFLITYVAMNLIDGHGQLALLYIVPFTLGSEPCCIEIVPWIGPRRWYRWLNFCFRHFDCTMWLGHSAVHAGLMEFCMVF
jgi:hypothetical protein